MIAAGRLLQRTMEAFRDAVPIILLLKNDALRKLHWEYLMGCTGRTFAWNVEGNFALGEIFDMELHRFKVGFIIMIIFFLGVSVMVSLCLSPRNTHRMKLRE